MNSTVFWFRIYHSENVGVHKDPSLIYNVTAKKKRKGEKEERKTPTDPSDHLNT